MSKTAKPLHQQMSTNTAAATANAVTASATTTSGISSQQQCKLEDDFNCNANPHYNCCESAAAVTAVTAASARTATTTPKSTTEPQKYYNGNISSEFTSNWSGSYDNTIAGSNQKSRHNKQQQQRQQDDSKFSYELYKEAAELLGLACTFSDDCRCLDCQSGYFDCGYSDPYMDDYESEFDEDELQYFMMAAATSCASNNRRPVIMQQSNSNRDNANNSNCYKRISGKNYNMTMPSKAIESSTSACCEYNVNELNAQAKSTAYESYKSNAALYTESTTCHCPGGRISDSDSSSSSSLELAEAKTKASPFHSIECNFNMKENANECNYQEIVNCQPIHYGQHAERRVGKPNRDEHDGDHSSGAGDDSHGDGDGDADSVGHVRSIVVAADIVGNNNNNNNSNNDNSSDDSYPDDEDNNNDADGGRRHAIDISQAKPCPASDLVANAAQHIDHEACNNKRNNNNNKNNNNNHNNNNNNNHNNNNNNNNNMCVEAQNTDVQPPINSKNNSLKPNQSQWATSTSAKQQYEQQQEYEMSTALIKALDRDAQRTLALGDQQHQQQQQQRQQFSMQKTAQQEPQPNNNQQCDANGNAENCCMHLVDNNNKTASVAAINNGPKA